MYRTLTLTLPLSVGRPTASRRREARNGAQAPPPECVAPPALPDGGDICGRARPSSRAPAVSAAPVSGDPAHSLTPTKKLQRRRQDGRPSKRESDAPSVRPSLQWQWGTGKVKASEKPTPPHSARSPVCPCRDGGKGERTDGWTRSFFSGWSMLGGGERKACSRAVVPIGWGWAGGSWVLTLCPTDQQRRMRPFSFDDHDIIAWTLLPQDIYSVRCIIPC